MNLPKHVIQCIFVFVPHTLQYLLDQALFVRAFKMASVYVELKHPKYVTFACDHLIRHALWTSDYKLIDFILTFVGRPSFLSIWEEARFNSCYTTYLHKHNMLCTNDLRELFHLTLTFNIKRWDEYINFSYLDWFLKEAKISPEDIGIDCVREVCQRGQSTVMLEWLYQNKFTFPCETRFRTYFLSAAKKGHLSFVKWSIQKQLITHLSLKDKNALKRLKNKKTFQYVEKVKLPIVKQYK